MTKMDVKLAIIADAANIGANGKLNILGAFDKITAKSFPFRHQRLTIVLRVECDTAPIDNTKQLGISLAGDDGEQVVEFRGEIQVPKRPDPLAEIQFLIEMEGVEFPHPGNYAFHVTIGAKDIVRLPITLLEER